MCQWHINLQNSMSQDTIEILDISGKPIALHGIETYNSLRTSHQGSLFQITNKRVINLDDSLNEKEIVPEKHRLVLASTTEEQNLLTNVKSIRCYLRGHDMKATIIEVNPYQSVRSLRASVESQRKAAVELIVNRKPLDQLTDSLINYVFQNAIIHVIEIGNQNHDTFTLLAKEPGQGFPVYRIQGVSGLMSVQQLAAEVRKHISIPQQSLTLFHSGRILSNDKNVSEYHLSDNSCVTIIDNRKHTKRLTLDQYKQRIAELQAVKDCNKEIKQFPQVSQRETPVRTANTMDIAMTDSAHYKQKTPKKHVQLLEEENAIIVDNGIIEDSAGNLIKSQTKILKIENSDYGISVHEQEPLDSEIEDVPQNSEFKIENNGEQAGISMPKETNVKEIDFVANLQQNAISELLAFTGTREPVIEQQQRPNMTELENSIDNNFAARNQAPGDVVNSETYLPDEPKQTRQYSIEDRSMVVSSALADSSNLLGEIPSTYEPFEGITVKLTESISQSIAMEPFQGIPVKLAESIIDSRREQGALQMEEDYVIPEEFEIVAIDIVRNEIRLKIRYDEIIDEISKKLADKLGKTDCRVTFFKDGTILQDYEMVNDLEIGPGDKLYFQLDQ